MFVQSKSTSPSRKRINLVSYILLQQGDVRDTNLTVTWVEIDVGSQQLLHHHQPEQVYVVVTGKGRMRVGDDDREVATGNLIHIPPDVPHGIENIGDEILSYVSATTPAFDFKAFYDEGHV
jgi:mannose-6-phosphate isomerase-like protein (cupin superfamily)